MADLDPRRRSLKGPESNHPDDRARVPLEAALSLIPFMGGILKLVSAIWPTQANRARKRWEKDVADVANQHSDRLDEHDQAFFPKTDLSGSAVILAVALARDPGDGMGGRHRDLDDLCGLVPDMSRKGIEDAVFELHDLGMVEITRSLNGWWLRLTQKFYEQLDHQVMDWQSTTAEDTKTLARLILEDDKRQRTSTLHEASGWEKRRFNPAFRGLLQFTPLFSKEIQSNYPSSSVILRPEDRARLQRLLKDKA